MSDGNLEEYLNEESLEESVNIEESEETSDNSNSDQSSENTEDDREGPAIDFDSGIGTNSETPAEELTEYASEDTELVVGESEGEASEDTKDKLISEPDLKPANSTYVPQTHEALSKESGGGIQSSGSSHKILTAENKSAIFDKKTGYALNGFSVKVDNKIYRVHEENSDIEILKALIVNGKYMATIKGERKLLEISEGYPKIVRDDVVKLQYANKEWKNP